MKATDKIAYSLIEMNVAKILKEVKENPYNGIPKLIEVGEKLIPNQLKENYQASKPVLIESPLFNYIIKHLANNVEHNIIKRFGINFGFNSLNIGRKLIRENKEYSIPWKINFNLTAKEQKSLSISQIDNIINEGENKGIYTYFFWLGDEYNSLRTLIRMLGKHYYCSFIIFIEPRQINKEVAESIKVQQNILTVLKYENSSQYLQALELLKQERCLVFSYSEKEEMNEVNTVIHFIINDSLYKPHQAKFTYKILLNQLLKQIDMLYFDKQLSFSIVVNGDIEVNGKPYPNLNLFVNSLDNALKLIKTT